MASSMFYGAVRISSKGQVVIPQRVREDFGLKTGDQLIILGRVEQDGFALMKPDAFLRVQQELASVQAQLSQLLVDPASIAAAAAGSTEPASSDPGEAGDD